MAENNVTYIPGRQKSASKNDPYIGEAKDIIDESLHKDQEIVNREGIETDASLRRDLNMAHSMIEAEEIARDHEDTQLRNELNAKQLELGAVETDSEPIPESPNYMTSGAIAFNFGWYRGNDNPEWVYVITDGAMRVLFGIKSDASIDWSVGVPKPVKDYFDENIGALIEHLEPLIIEGLEHKVDKEEGKSLINKDYADSITFAENPEFIEVKLDEDGRIIKAIRVDGTEVFGAGYEIGGTVTKNIYIPEFIEVCTDREGKLLEATMPDGTKVLPAGVEIGNNGANIKIIINPEYLQLTTDLEDKVLCAVKKDGSYKFNSIIAKNLAVENLNITGNVSDSLKNIILDVAKDGKYAGDVRSYYFDNVDGSPYLPTKVARIKQLISNGYTRCMFINADTHWEQNQKQSPSLLKYIKDNTNIKKFVHLGDINHGAASDRDYIDKILSIFDMRNIDIVFGNHEYQITTNKYELANMYNMYNHDRHGSFVDNYYYYDDHCQKVRYIVLAAYTNANNAGVAQDGYTQTQLDWISNEALNGVPAGYDIMVFEHKACIVSMSKDNPFVIYGKDTKMTNLFDSYKSSHPSCHIIMFEGHQHCDRIYYTTGGIPVVIVTCDKNTVWPLWEERQDPTSPYYNYRADIDVDRTSGTIREQAFDVCMMNPETHHVVLVRIGGKARDGVENEQGNEVEERALNY